ncbi:MAG TPA: hypothetical protein VN366_00690 [Feifaniaceae bacterium]|nr:hypothetical protein [Feifaniaceae bacterium]
MPVWLILAFAVFSGFIIYAIVALNKKGRKQPAKAVLSAYIVFALVYLVIWIFAFSVPPYVILLAMLAVFIDCFFGYYLNWYNRSKVFDRYLHAYGAFSFALLTYCLIKNLFEAGGSRAFRSLFVFAAGMALGAVFELVEAAVDQKSGAGAQRGLKDTNTDMLGNLIGSALAGLFAYCFLFS